MRYLFFALALIAGISAVTAPTTATAQDQQGQGQRCPHYVQSGNDDSSFDEDACP
jgi:hypothetical protein